MLHVSSPCFDVVGVHRTVPAALFDSFDAFGAGALSENEFIVLATTLNPKPAFAGNVQKALEEFTWCVQCLGMQLTVALCLSVDAHAVHVTFFFSWWSWWWSCEMLQGPNACS